MNRIVTRLSIGRNFIESALCKWHQFTAEVLVNLIRPPDKNIRDIDTKIETGYLPDLFYTPPRSMKLISTACDQHLLTKVGWYPVCEKWPKMLFFRCFLWKHQYVASCYGLHTLGACKLCPGSVPYQFWHQYLEHFCQGVDFKFFFVWKEFWNNHVHTSMYVYV